MKFPSKQKEPPGKLKTLSILYFLTIGGDDWLQPLTCTQVVLFCPGVWRVYALQRPHLKRTRIKVVDRRQDWPIHAVLYIH